MKPKDIIKVTKMKKKILSMIIAIAMTMCMAGCTNAAEKAAEQERIEAEALAEQERLEAEAEAARLEEERIAAEKAEEERLEQERLEAEAAEAARVEELRTQIAKIIEEDVPVLMEEMTANYNQDGLTALSTLVDEYDETTSDVDEFMASYDQIVADKEEYDAAWEEFPYLVTALDETVRYAAQSVNIRSLPSEDGEILGNFNTNDEITVIGESGDWYQISYDDDTAYVFKSLTSENKVEVAATTGGSTSGGQWASYPRNQWIDMGNYFICFGTPPTSGVELIPTVEARTGAKAGCGTIMGFPTDSICVISYTENGPIL